MVLFSGRKIKHFPSFVGEKHPLKALVLLSEAPLAQGGRGARAGADADSSTLSELSFGYRGALGPAGV